MINTEQADALQASQAKNWQTIYPIYINKDKTIAEGRRIPKEKAIAAPTIQEIGEICQYYKLNHLVEPRKAYPRDWINPGRVKVQLFKEDDKPFNDQITSKNDFMLKLAELIPKLKSRAQPAATQESTQGGGGGGKKKNKKR